MADSRPTGAYNYKTLLCTDIPELFLDKFVARSHFGRFGTLTNFVLRPRRMTCTVSYATEDEAELALLEGGAYNGHQFHMSYAERESAPAHKTEEWVDPDVQAELSALTAGWRSDYPQQPQQGKSVKSSAALSPAPQAVAAAAAPSHRNPPSAPPPTSTRERPAAQCKELESLMRRPAHTAEEKYRVLDARDKLLRLNRTHKQQLFFQSSSGATQGYCPDMCPEKERMLREFQRQVAVYELEAGSDEHINHKRALKQYSRSSADQETPLPHELRAEPALHMTMSYLMHEIMDICERSDEGSHVGDWFHFVWDRTRSIRKEITQQELCSLGAVKLVEQCARFHIHCAARLVAEDPSVFDSKINAENLTKCLQTLKYMYHDLRLKGVQCPREAEFRGYIVLLNLADANFLWDIGQLPAELQNCPEVRQAIQFYLALHDTNFVRFFTLVRDEETSYLSACILVTYFTRLRVLGLHRLIQAYRAPRKNEVSSLPLSYVAQMLCFGADQEAAAHFVQHYGLEVTDGGRVVLTRTHSVETDYKLPRQMELVESKRRQTVGECICGEPLPPKSLYLSHTPHNSFNEHSVLKGIAWSAKDQLPGMQEKEEEPQRPQFQNDNFFKVPMQPREGAAGELPAPSVPAPSPAIANFSFVLPKSGAQAMQELAEQQQQRQQRAQEEAKHQALQQAIAEAKKREAELMAIQAAKVAEAQRVRQQKLRERQQAEAEEQRRRQQEEQEELERQRRLREREELLRLEREREEKLKALRLVEQQQREARQKELTLDCYQKLFEETLADICGQELRLHNQARSTFDSLVDEITRSLAEQEMQQSLYELGIQRVFWRRWRNYRGVQQQKDTLFNQLPLSFAADRPEALVNERNLEGSLRMIRRYRQGIACDYGRLLTGLEEHSWLKLDLWRVLAECLPQRRPGALRFYKLLLLLSHPSGHQLDLDLDRGLLQRPQAQEARVEPEPGVYIRALHQGIALSVVKIKSSGSQQERKLADQADGIICLAGVADMSTLLPLLKNLVRRSHSPDVAVIMQYPGNASWQEPQLPLKDLGVRHSRIFPFRQTTANVRQRLMSQLDAAVRFLASAKASASSAPQQQLQQAELREFLTGHLGRELFQRLKQACKEDLALRQRCQQCPQYCVALYNEAVHRLQLVAGEDLGDCPRLPEELRIFVDSVSNTSRWEYFEPGWHLPERRQRIVELLEWSKLPRMPPLLQGRGHSSLEEQQCEWVLNYVELSLQEEQVEAIAVQAIKCLQSEDGEVAYLNFVELMAGERLQYALHRELELPKGMVYNTETMKNCFLCAWYYQFQEQQVPRAQKEQEDEEDEEEDMEQPLDELDFDQIMNRAEAILDKCRKRQTLRELNGPAKSSKESNATHSRRDKSPENHPQRKRLKFNWSK